MFKRFFFDKKLDLKESAVGTFKGQKEKILDTSKNNCEK